MAATASAICLTPSIAGVTHQPVIPPASAQTASQLLQFNHDHFHMFYNRSGFHNHIAHHLLSLFALGASPEELQQAFDTNKDHQRPQLPVDESNVSKMSDHSSAAGFQSFLGREEHFHDFEAYFSREIEKHPSGWRGVLTDQLFAKTEHSERLLVRMYAGFLHPLIHLGFGIEFQQPAIIVEALAQAAIHTGWIGPFLLEAEKEAARVDAAAAMSLFELLDELNANETIRHSVDWSDGNKIRDGVLVRAGPAMCSLASRFRVTPATLRRKTAEMINFTSYFAGAAQRPDKEVKFDFFHMHSVNCSIFFSSFLEQDWMSDQVKCRLLEWKGRMDLAMYASRNCAHLDPSYITHYEPKHPGTGWDEIVGRVARHEDDGHAAKLIRALRNGELACKELEEAADCDWRVKGPMWEQLGHMAIDSVEGGGPRWVRNAGFDRAWTDVPDRKVDRRL